MLLAPGPSHGQKPCVRDSEHPQPIVEAGEELAGPTERQHSLMPPFQSPKQQFILQQQETMKESHCSAAWASMDLTQVLPLHLVPGGIQQSCLSAGEAPWCLQVRLSPCWGVWLPELTSVHPQIAGQSLLLILVCVVKTSINAAAFWGQ